MPSLFCAIPFCNKASQRKWIFLFSAPNDDHDRRQKWIDFVKSESLRSGYDNDLNYDKFMTQLQQGIHFRICSHHFCDDDLNNEIGFLKLSSTAVPSVMIPILPGGRGTISHNIFNLNL